MKAFHGSRKKLKKLAKQSYISLDIDIAKGYGKYVYIVDVIPDYYKTITINGMRCIGEFTRGDCRIFSMHYDLGFYESITRKELTIELILDQ